jgi:hypothetical protein
MAATGFTPISLYYSTTASAAPLAANLVAGELSLNTLDEKLYFKNSAGTVKLLASNAASSGTVSSVAATVPSLLSITGSPITTSGTLAITYSGTALPAANGGTGQTSYAVGDLLYASTTTALSKLADVATGNALISGGVSTAPSWGKIGLTTHVSGTLAVANGGTGDTTYTNGQLLIGNTTGNTLTKATLTAGSGISITNGTGSISIAASGGSLTGVTDSATPFETSLGTGAGAVTTGIRNTFIGFEAGNDNTTGTTNTAVGYQAFALNVSGLENTAVGSSALGANTTSSNTAVGFNALTLTTTGNANTAVGAAALSANTTGADNSGFGQNSLIALTTGSGNVAIGKSTLAANSTNSQNTAVGVSALSAATADDNTAVGRNAGAAVTTGTQNVLIGRSAGFSGTNNLTTGSNNIIIGYNAAASSATASNVITLGNSSIATLRCQVTTITALSDARDKTNVADLNAGLGFVNALRPVKFDWNMRDGGKVGVPDTGFIAQDLQSVQATTGIEIPDLVFAENPDRLEAGYGKLIPVLVKAVQELSAEVERLKSQIKG